MTTEALAQRDIFGGRHGEYELPEGAYITRCASCGAGMAFVKTPNGKAMPLSLATVEARDDVKYALPHWIDCPQAKQWSKRS